MSLEKKLVTPQSILIEQTALSLACEYYEAGRSAGLTSKFKNPKSFAKANVEKFIPLAVDCLMKILANPATPQEQRDLIYEAFMERSNDPDLSDCGIGAFKNDTPFLMEGQKLYDKTTLDNVFDKVQTMHRLSQIEDAKKTKPIIVN